MEDSEERQIIQELRKNNIADNERILAQIRSELKAFMPEIYKAKTQKEGSSKKRKRTGSPVERRFNPSRSARFSPPKTRSRSSSVSSSSTISSPEKMVVRFGFFGRHDNDSDRFHDSDEENEEEFIVRKKKSARIEKVREIKSVDEITDDDIEMVADTVKDKRYDSVYGTTCHQCRQKTDDMKTICRSENCFGVRGQFCGPCLRNRYGENAKEALKDPDWICPPCRDICNCSFCRKRKGKSSTGILIHLAKENGYTNVNDYLQSLKHKLS